MTFLSRLLSTTVLVAVLASTGPVSAAKMFDPRSPSAAGSFLAGQAAPRNPNLRLTSERLVASAVEWYGPARLVGQFVDVLITEAMSNSLRGRVLTANAG